MAQRSYTTIDDPRWNYRHIDQLNQLLSAFVEARRKKKAEQEGRAFETAQLAIGAIDKGADPNDPSIQAAFAAMPAAQGGVLRAMAKAAAGDTEGKKAATNAYNSLLKRAEEQRQAELLKALGGTPEMLASDETYGRAMQQTPGLPELLQQSMHGMPIDQQMAALPQMQKAGVDMNIQAPAQFDPYGGDMPNDVAALAYGLGMQPGQALPPEVMQAIRYKHGTPTPSEVEAQDITRRNLGLREREVRLREEGGGTSPSDARAARAEARAIANQKRSEERQALADERQRVKDQVAGIRSRALEIRQEHADAQVALAREEKTPPPAAEVARAKAARELAPQLSPRLGAALEQVASARQALAAQAGTEKVPAMSALRKAEDETLKQLAAGKDPELLAEALERFLAALGQR